MIQDVTDDDRLLRRAANGLMPQYAAKRNADTTGMTEKAAGDYSQLNVEARRPPFFSNTRYRQSRAIWRMFPAGRSLDLDFRKAFLFSPFISPSSCLLQLTRPKCGKPLHARAIGDERVALYAVDPRGLAGHLGPHDRHRERRVAGDLRTGDVPGYRIAPVGPEHVETADLNLLAGLTGGAAYYNDNGLEDSMLEAVEDGDVTYSLGFYPAEDSQDGRVHKIKVNAAKSGVSLRYRESYFATKTQSEAIDRPTLDRLMRDPLDATQIGLVAEAPPDPARPGFFNVHVSVDLHNLQLGNQDGKWLGALDLAFHVEESTSAQTTSRTIEIPEEKLAAALEKGFTFDHTIEWHGKTGNLRVVVEDKASGAAGSLRIPLGKK